ncbi:hypothetical protein BDP27DRAFT_1193649, partial [Rhodocollybia butyracea]
ARLSAPKPALISFEPTTHAQRNPLLPTQSLCAHPKRTLDPVQARTMNKAKAEKQRLTMLARDDVVKLAEEFEENIAGLAQKHSVTVEYLKGLMSMTSKYKRKRATGRMQALVYLKGKEVNLTLPPGSKLKAPALRKLVDEDEELRTISDEKIEQLKHEVEEKRLLSTRGIRPTNLSAAKDYLAFSQSVKKEFDSLHVQTGAVGFGFLCPGTSDDKGFPAWFVAGNKTSDFVRHHLNTTMWDLLLEMELWTTKKESDASHTERPATILEIQSQSSAMIASSLHKSYILKDKSMNMNYASYHTSIVAKHHVQLIGLPNFQTHQPFDIKDRKALEALHGALESGACCWSRMSAEEVKEHDTWIQTQAPKERAVRSDKGTKRGRCKGTADTDNNSNENQAPPPKRQQIGSQKSKGRVTGSKGGQSTAAKRACITKKLPPQPTSTEFVDSDEDGDSS